MERSKLLDLLRSFSSVEFRQFCKFVASPYFNKQRVLIRFSRYLEELAPTFPAESLNKGLIFELLFPGQFFSETKVADMMNALLNLAEDFLAIRRFQLEEVQKKCHVLDEYTNRKLDKHYNFLYRKLCRDLNRAGQKADTSFYKQYLLAQSATNHFYSKQTRKFDPSLQAVSDELDKLYFYHKLKYSCEMLNRQAIIKADYRLVFVEEVKQFLLQQKHIDPLINIYLNIFLMLSFPDEEAHFKKLLTLIETQVSGIERQMRRGI